MRMLFHKRKNSPFFLSFDIPSNRQLSTLAKVEPKAYKLLFAEDDGNESPIKRSVGDLLEVARSYLKRHKSEAKIRSPKSVRHKRFDCELDFGAARGLTGFEIGGIPCGASISDKCLIIEFVNGEELEVYADTYPVDRGELLIAYNTGSSIYDLFFRLERSLSTLKTKSVWIVIEY